MSRQSEAATVAYLDGIFGPGSGQKHIAFLNRIESPALREMLHGYHALESELGPRGVLCNAVSFSLIDTDGARRAVGEKNTAATRAYLEKRALTRRAVEPEHVTSAVAFLASPLCQNITGEVLTVDGGYARAYL